MNVLKLFSAAMCCLILSLSVNADSRKELQTSAGSNSQPDPGWYCDHWPDLCVEVCEYGQSPWGPYTICKLRPEWNPVPASDNPYRDLGVIHNEALQKIGAKSEFASLDARLTTSHMVQLSAEYLCENNILDQFNEKATEDTKTAKKECIHRSAGLATEVFNDLRKAVYLDGSAKEIAKAYLAAFRNKGVLNAEQLSAISELYALLPSDDDIEQLPKLFEQIDNFERYVERQMSVQDAEVVLQGSAIMRASLEYWLDQINEPSDWFSMEDLGTEPVAARKGIFKKILKIIAADAGGCLGGALIGGVGGCVVGGIGASAGAGANW